MAVSGHNGNNETFIGVSNSMGLTLYDENSNEIPITKASVPFDIVLQRDSHLPEYLYYYVNASTFNSELCENVTSIYTSLRLSVT